MRKALIALILAGSLAAGRPALLEQLWLFLDATLTAPTGDEGCGLDPSGCPKGS